MAKVRVGINGFGRIGRLVFRAGFEHVDIVGINDLGDVKTAAHLLKYDSTHGRYGKTVTRDEKNLIVDGKKINMTAIKDPAEIPWKAMGVDIVLECTGVFKSKDDFMKHLAGGAKRVLVSAPADGVDKTIVFGVNDNALTKDDIIVSNASCTTNCLVPMAKVLHDTFGIEKGFMTTIHSYTGDQPTLDTMHKDLYRGRAAALSMIPTSTGAAKAVGLVMPDLNGKLDGVSVRVPTPNVSLVDLKFVSKRPTTVAEVNDAMKAAANGPLKGVLVIVDAPLVSHDFNHQPASCSFALDQTKVLDGNFVQTMGWYDNEWGFSNRMADTAVALGKLI